MFEQWNWSDFSTDVFIKCLTFVVSNTESVSSTVAVYYVHHTYTNIKFSLNGNDSSMPRI